nr:MAG TPA: Photosystem II reaction centre I protein (PSII 4.8 kDa protein) [Caudoviricetes sp.]
MHYATTVNDFFIFSFLSYNPVNNPLRGYGCI